MILERYIHREIFDKLLWIIGILILILTSNRFVEYLADAASGNLPSDLILSMLLMKMLAVLPRLLPFAIFLSVILALTRLAHDKELTAIAGAGLAAGFQLRCVFKFSLVFALFVFIVTYFTAPWAEVRVHELKGKARQESDITGITAGRFKEFSQGDRVVYVKELSDEKESMKNIFLQVRQQQRLGVMTADSAHYEFDDISGSRYILFSNGQRYVGTPGELDFQITEYRKYAVLVDQGNEATAYQKLEATPTSELMGSDLPMHKAEFQWRLSYVLSSLLLPLLAVALGRFSFSENRYVTMFIGILIYFIYSNFLGISKTLLKRDDIPAFIGLWWVHILLITTTVIFLKLHGMQLRRNKHLKRQYLPHEK